MRINIYESEKKHILNSHGLLREQNYMKNYSGTLLDFCGYRSIEKFEETMGTPQGQSMGDKYFESKVSEYETLITTNITNTITIPTFKSLPPKLRMQIWSFMFNSTDASTGSIKWLAGLGQAMGLNKNSDAKNEQEYRLRVISKQPKEYGEVINYTSNFNGNWDSVYNNYLNVLDQQYKSTAENNNLQGSYENSWKYRPKKLDEFYNECSGSKDSTPKPTDDSQKKTDGNQPSQITTPPGVQLKNKPMSEDNKKSFLESFPCLNDLVGASYREIFNRRLQEHEPIIITRSGENYLYHYLNGTVLEVEIKPENNNVPKTLNVGKINCE